MHKIITDKWSRLYTRKSFLKLSASTVFTTACYSNDIFKYSIHEVKGDYSGDNINLTNAAIIETIYDNPDADFTFAVIADSHSYFDELNDAIKIISAKKDVCFVIHLGDFTDSGLLFEYEQSISILKKLPIPHVTVIGNHDTLGNGLKIFNDIFGATDFSFLCNGVFFIIANNNNWETDIGSFDDVTSLIENHQNDRYRIVITHIPVLNGSRFSDELCCEYSEFCLSQNVNLSLHGHKHKHKYMENFTEKTSMLVTDAILNRVFYLVHANSSGIEFEMVTF